MRLIRLQLNQDQVHRPIDRNSDNTLALVDPAILGQDLLIFAIQIGEIFQTRLGMQFLHVRDALALRNQKKGERRQTTGPSPDR